VNNLNPGIIFAQKLFHLKIGPHALQRLLYPSQKHGRTLLIVAHSFSIDKESADSLFIQQNAYIIKHFNEFQKKSIK